MASTIGKFTPYLYTSLHSTKSLPILDKNVPKSLTFLAFKTLQHSPTVYWFLLTLTIVLLQEFYIKSKYIMRKGRPE